MSEVRSNLLPRAREGKLIVRELPDELLVYDLQRDKAHCLNKTSAFVWRHCDGKTEVAEMLRLFESEFGSTVDADVVWLALNQLRRLHLLAEDGAPVRMKVSRRELVRKYLPAALVVPLILSIPAPAAAVAASGCPSGQSVCGAGCCPTAQACCNGVCCSPGQNCTGPGGSCNTP